MHTLICCPASVVVTTPSFEQRYRTPLAKITTPLHRCTFPKANNLHFPTMCLAAAPDRTHMCSGLGAGDTRYQRFAKLKPCYHCCAQSTAKTDLNPERCQLVPLLSIFTALSANSTWRHARSHSPAELHSSSLHSLPNNLTTSRCPPADAPVFKFQRGPSLSLGALPTALLKTTPRHTTYLPTQLPADDPRLMPLFSNFNADHHCHLAPSPQPC